LIFIKTLRQTIIVWIVAMHTRLPSWVNRDRSIQRQPRPMSALTPIATKMVRRGERR